MDYKAVIFDFNGTLFFDNDKHVLAWEEISKIVRGHGISEDELHTHFNGVPNAKVIQYLDPQMTDPKEVARLSALKEEYYRHFCKEDVKNFHLVEGAELYFYYLKQRNIPFTIASASIKENIDFFIESFNLDKWMDPKDIVYDDGTYENKIMMFKDAARKLNVSLKECLIIEDSVSGITNAYQAGCENIVVIDSAGKKNEYEKLPGVKKILDNFIGI